MKPLKKVSVKSLVEFTQRSGSLEVIAGSVPDPVKAIHAHQKIQESRSKDDYQKEVSLKYRVESEYLDLEIKGRADGLFTSKDNIIIEEIKTTLDSPEQAALKNDPLHWGQVKVYAYIYAIQNGLKSIIIQLTYCHLETLELHSVEEETNLDTLTVFFSSLIGTYIQWLTVVHQHRIKRDASAKKLVFPFSDYRPGQREMAVRIYDTVRNRENIIIQAPTGIGKTMSALFSTIKAIGEGKTEKVYYLSAHNTGHIQVENMLSQLGESGLNYTYVRLAARERLCPMPEMECDPDVCKNANGYYDRLLPALNDAFENYLTQPDHWKMIMEKHHVCPHPFLLELSSWVDCVICDYNYLFDPLVNLYDFTEKNRPEYTVLIDEAHNLVSRSREMFSAKLNKQKVLRVRKLLKTSAPVLYKKLSSINAWILEKSKTCDNKNAKIESNVSERLLKRLSAFVIAAKDLFSSGRFFKGKLEVIDLFFEVIIFLKTSDHFDIHYTMIYQKTDKDFDIHIFCINTSKQIAKAIDRVGTAVFFSATLTPFSYYKDLFGLNSDTISLKLDSPFPPNHFLTLTAGNISTRYNHREKTAVQISHLLHQFDKMNHGNLLFFFPSYVYLKMISDLFIASSSETRVIIQKSSMSDDDRTDFLALFTEQRKSKTIGFAVMGGIFGEGIDLVGTSLTGVAVLGVGLPGISIEENLVKQHYDENIGHGYDYAYVFPGMNRVLQAAGRVIRSDDDKGVLLLIDDRYNQPKYKQLMPVTWSPKNIQTEVDFGQAVEQFWNNNA